MTVLFCVEFQCVTTITRQNSSDLSVSWITRSFVPGLKIISNHWNDLPLEIILSWAKARLSVAPRLAFHGGVGCYLGVNQLNSSSNHWAGLSQLVCWACYHLSPSCSSPAHSSIKDATGHHTPVECLQDLPADIEVCGPSCRGPLWSQVQSDVSVGVKWSRSTARIVYSILPL